MTMTRTMPAVMDSITEAIGNTPMIRIRHFAKEFPDTTVLAKLEILNPNGSMKDRIGLRMIEQAEAEGRIKPGDTLVEPTSGNTGLGLCIVGAAKGYKVLITMPEKMSMEKENFARAFGAEVLRAPTELAHDHPDGFMALAHNIVKERPDHHMLDQYKNPNNPNAHYYTTGPEIWEQTDGKLDYLVAGMGTGGTISGTGKFLKEKNPNIVLVGADPEGSIYSGDTPKPYNVEGIGYDFYPDNLNLDIIDHMYRIGDTAAFTEAHALARGEGILGGGSTGSVLASVRKLLADPKFETKGKTVVMFIHDSGRNYLTKMYNPEWLKEKGFSV